MSVSKEMLDSVYSERNKLVALVARLSEMLGYKVGIKEHIGEEYEDDWRNVLFIDLPTGQVSWHLHKSELTNFLGVQPYDGEWDKHSTEEKYSRVIEMATR